MHGGQTAEMCKKKKISVPYKPKMQQQQSCITPDQREVGIASLFQETHSEISRNCLLQLQRRWSHVQLSSLPVCEKQNNGWPRNKVFHAVGAQNLLCWKLSIHCLFRFWALTFVSVPESSWWRCLPFRLLPGTTLSSCGSVRCLSSSSCDSVTCIFLFSMEQNPSKSCLVSENISCVFCLHMNPQLHPQCSCSCCDHLAALFCVSLQISLGRFCNVMLSALEAFCRILNKLVFLTLHSHPFWMKWSDLWTCENLTHCSATKPKFETQRHSEKNTEYQKDKQDLNAKTKEHNEATWKSRSEYTNTRYRCLILELCTNGLFLFQTRPTYIVVLSRKNNLRDSDCSPVLVTGWKNIYICLNKASLFVIFL